MRARGQWSNRQVATLLMACAAGLYVVSIIIVLVRN
jgi:hypothetical protein